MTKIFVSLLLTAFTIPSLACMASFSVQQVVEPTSLAISQGNLVIFDGDILAINHEVFQMESTFPDNAKATMLLPIADTGNRAYFQILEAGKIVLKKAMRGQPETTLELTVQLKPRTRCM